MSIMSQGEQMEVRKGWSVEITRKDKTTFFSCGGAGILPPVWTNTKRHYAVEYKRDLIKNGFKAKVVPILYCKPVKLEE